MKPFFRLRHVSRAFLRVGVACLLTLLGVLFVILSPSPVTQVTHASGPCGDGWHLEGNVCYNNCNPGTHPVGLACVKDAQDPPDAAINIYGAGGTCPVGFSFENNVETSGCYSNCDPGTYMGKSSDGHLFCKPWPDGFPGN